MANNGREGVTMLVREPVAANGQPSSARRKVHEAYYLVKSAWPICHCQL